MKLNDLHNPSIMEIEYKNDWFNKLQEKWCEIPQDIKGERIMSSELLNWDDKKLNDYYDQLVINDKPVRKIFEEPLYEKYRGKRILDFGSGMGNSSIQFALHGANITFMDLVEDNLKVILKIMTYKKLEGTYICLTEIDDIDTLPHQHFDYIFCCGSLMNAPQPFMVRELYFLESKLKCGGEFHILSYPKQRWLNCGCPSFEEFGKMTDGERTPYCEWYDGEKFLNLLSRTGCKQDYEIISEYNFQNDDFNWIEIKHQYTPQNNELPEIRRQFNTISLNSAREEDGDFFLNNI
jgi:2-polyprenyl-3-methyl-5-hydroxy-6-metoxy-1,4-benzoquinol methylase